MSRVKSNQKYVNTPKYNNEITNISKAKRVHSKNEDYTKAGTLSAWLFMKYDMSYKTYRNKSRNRREELRQEFEDDTGIIQERNEYDEYEAVMELLAEIGVPFAPDGTPLGIG